jgi:hypothetical protein
MVRRFWGPAPPPKGFRGKPPEFPHLIEAGGGAGGGSTKNGSSFITVFFHHTHKTEL